MAKTNKIPKNIKYRLIKNRIEKKNKIFCYLKDSHSDYLHINSDFSRTIQKNLYKSRQSQIRNICIVTFRSRGSLSKFKVSRHEFKRMSRYGRISGLIK